MREEEPHFFVYETVSIPLDLEDVRDPEAKVLENYKKVVVDISQYDKKRIRKWDDVLGIDVENNRINVSLSQEETALFDGGTKESPKKALIQVNIYRTDTERDTTFEEYINVYRNQHDEVIDGE